MNERSELNIELNAAAFRSFYYLKQELADFCRENGLPHRTVKQNSQIELHTFLIREVY